VSKKIQIQVEKDSGLVLNYDEIPYPIRRAITGRYRTIYGTKDEAGVWTNYLNPDSKQVLENIEVVLVNRTKTSKKVIASVSKILSLENLSKDELIAILRKLIE